MQKNAPAFPPQVAQDHLGRLIAPIPGLTKLEYFAIQLLPYFLGTEKNWSKNGSKLTAYQSAVVASELLLDELEKAIQSDEHEPKIIE